MINPLRLVLEAVVFIGLQVLLFQELELLGVALAKPYLLFLLFLPVRLPQELVLVIAFGYGLVLDIFLLTFGLNAFAAVLLVAFRPAWLRVVSGQGGLALDESFNLRQQARNLSWLIAYLVPAICVFEFAYYVLGDLSLGGETLLKFLGSSLVTSVSGLLIALLAYRATER